MWEGHRRQGQPVRRTPKEFSIETANGPLDCDRRKNSSFSTVPVASGPPLECLEHHQCIDETSRWMLKGIGQPTHNLEAHPLPKADRSLVSADDKIKLHGSIMPRPGMIERVFAHAARNPAACCRRACDVAAIADVATATSLARTHVISADELAFLFGDKGLLVRSHPVSERIGLAQSWIERLSLDSAVHVLTSAACVIISPQDLKDGAKDKLPWPRGERAGDHLGIKSP
jgi:hypothetical protein